MARVAIDPHMFGEEWFRHVRAELVRSKNVTFAYSGLKKEGLELSKQRAALFFFKLMGELKRRDDASIPHVEKNMSEITSHQSWKKNARHCDDEHTFALVRTLPTPYVFSCDLRLAKCRGCISGKIDSRFTRFSVISSLEVYNSNRAQILA